MKSIVNPVANSQHSWLASRRCARDAVVASLGRLTCVAAVLTATACVGQPDAPSVPTGAASAENSQPSQGAASGGSVQFGPGLRVNRAAHEVTVEARVALDAGWLEQAVCRTGTREHESLLSVDVAPSRIHAALLVAGFEPGAPGSWRMRGDDEGGGIERIAPKGSPLQVFVRIGSHETPLSAWVVDPVTQKAFPEQPWVFAGSRIRPNTKSMGPGEHYVADFTGSVVGIVTFGDEPVALREVIADMAEADAPLWQARTDAMPPSGTAVELIFRAELR